MTYISDALDEVKRATPEKGVNVCIFDDFEDVGEKLTVIEHFDTVEEAQKFIDEYEDEDDDEETELIMYEADPQSENGESFKEEEHPRNSDGK